MKSKARLVLAGVVSMILVVAAWAAPRTTFHSNSQSASAVVQDTTPPQAASGTISAVEKTSFTITLTPAKVGGPSAVSQQDPPKSMTFLIDANTTIEGKLAVGSNADVTYRDDNTGNHVALGVRVTPAQ
jgi:cytoskeletal protein RodZ